jgi:hypothetical protein
MAPRLMAPRLMMAPRPNGVAPNAAAFGILQ